MYRKNLRGNMAAEVPHNGFFNRLADFPVSKAALEQLSTLYENAHQQKLLGMSLTAGEYTFRFAGKVASPIMNKLPVETLDSIACKQLDALEKMVPGIKKEPKEIMAASEEFYNKAKAVPSNTIQIVKDAGYSTVTGVKVYAVETISPTVERVEQVKSYGADKVNIATTYTKEKIDGVKETYEGVKSGELVNNCYSSIRGGVVNQYEGLKDGVVHKYDGALNTVSGVKHGLVDGYVKAKTELYNYTAQTIQPSITRYNAAKSYGAETFSASTNLVSGAYTGIKDVTFTVVDSVTNNRIVNSVKNNGVVQSVNGSVIGILDYVSDKVDTIIPPPEGTDYKEMNPASPEAGTWTKTMILMTNLRNRLYFAGQLRVKPYLTQAGDMASSVKTVKDSTSERLASVYKHTTDTYTNTTAYITGTYHNGLDYANNTYKAAQDRYNGALVKTNGMYTNVGSTLTSTKERVYITFHTVHTHLDTAKSRLYVTWTHSADTATSLYGYASETLHFAQDYTMKWIGQEPNEELEMKSIPIQNANTSYK